MGIKLIEPEQKHVLCVNNNIFYSFAIDCKYDPFVALVFLTSEITFVSWDQIFLLQLKY